VGILVRKKRSMIDKKSHSRRTRGTSSTKHPSWGALKEGGVTGTRQTSACQSRRGGDQLQTKEGISRGLEIRNKKEKSGTGWLVFGRGKKVKSTEKRLGG